MTKEQEILQFACEIVDQLEQSGLDEDGQGEVFRMAREVRYIRQRVRDNAELQVTVKKA